MSYGIPFADLTHIQDGYAVVRIQPLAHAVRALAGRAGATLVVTYPDSAQGSIAAHELRSWLIALGVPSGRLRLVPGNLTGNVVGLRVNSGGMASP